MPATLDALMQLQRYLSQPPRPHQPSMQLPPPGVNPHYFAFQEGAMMPSRQRVSDDIQREFDTQNPDGRPAQLEDMLWQNRIFPRYDVPLPEGMRRPDIRGMSPYQTSPLNQLMGRFPGMALY